MDKSTFICDYLSMSNVFTVVFKDELLQIFNYIDSAFDIRMSVFDVNFKEILPLERRQIHTFCRQIRTIPGKLQACLDSDAKECRKAKETGKVNYYKCHAGLREAIYPLFVENEIIAYIVIGQYRSSKAISPVLLAGLDSEKTAALVSAYETLPLYKEEKIQSILNLVEIITRYIMEHKIVTIRQNRLADKVEEYLRENIASSICLAEIAAHFAKSPSTITQTLKKVTGKSFKKLYLDIKIEKACELMSQNPQIPVYEVAHLIGVEDPFYFSRLFKKQTGQSPQNYKATCSKSGL